jgi:hypothetical protein
MILLIHPPVTKPCEPPAGMARLSAALSMYRVEHHLLDANLEGLLHLLKMPLPSGKAADTWTRRAFRNLGSNLLAMRDLRLYRNIDRYRRTVRDISRVLTVMSPEGIMVGLANFGHDTLSPLKSKDLLSAAERPELNPFYPYFSSRLEGLFSSREPAAVGISVNFLSQALSAFSIIGFIKREAPKTKVILGGGLVTSWLSRPHWKNPFIGLVDHLVAGPGEHKLLSLLGVRDAGKGIPKPDYGSLPKADYLSPGFVLPYSSSSGCYWNRCSFCPEKAEGNPYVPIPPKQAVSDLKLLVKDTNPSLIHFLDNAISPALLNDLSAEKLGVPWYGFARISSHLTDQGFCMKLKQAGCVMLKLGIESGDQGMLDEMNKGVTVEIASAVLKNLKKAGIASYVYLIFGTPAETEAGARNTLDFTVKHSDCIDFLNLALFNMPVNSEIAEGIRTKNFYEGDLSLYTDFDHPESWDRKSVRLFLENDFKRHPAISAILKKEPPVFTSNHAPFFV